MHLRSMGSLAAGVAAIFLATVTAASAAGTARFQQRDGTVNTYPVTIAFIHSSIRIAATDGHDTIDFPHAACSYAGELQRCLPYKIVLHRNGTSHDIAFEHGTVYINLTGAPQSLPFSTKKVPPNGLALVVRSERGTYITVNGTLDMVKQ
jgi:hypothetical protein